MNSDALTPPLLSPEPGDPAPAAPMPPFDWRYWARRLLVCNPFFLCSVALLLLGVDKLSGDRGFLGGDETRQLLFVFFALQIYELVVVGTALVLARRRVWYDSALLTVLDQGLVLVPFMMMSQAVLTGWRLTFILAATGGAMAVGRALAIRKWHPRFNLPPRALALGGALLLLNLGLPVAFRFVMKEDYERWAGPNAWLWIVALPVLAAGANLLPRPVRYGGIGPERHWLPLFLFGLWLAGTAVHVWSVGYVAKLPLPLASLAPLAVVVAWTMVNRISDCLPEPSWRWRGAMLLLVFGAPLFALERPEIFFPLALLNLAGFVALWRKVPGELARVARGLALASGPLFVAGIPEKWFALLGPELARVDPLGAGIVLFIAGAAFHSVRWQVGAFGAAVVAFAMGGIYPHGVAHAAVQTGIVVLFIHSLRWVANDRTDHRALRWSLAATWIGDAAVWTHGAGWEPEIFTTLGAALVAAAALGMWLRWKLPMPHALWAGCAGAALAGPGNWFVANSRPGLIALAGSLALFAVGTALAWTRHRWEQHPHPSGTG
ncbi:MAG: hypothetical protein HY301_11455 [Verrucomicrobia bacterium]|nr:hypothetical protein [Verrucomicrobiota bacterium]